MTNNASRAAHAEVKMLLPWYANGTLGLADHDRVLDHLEACADCRAALSLCIDTQACVQQEGPVAILPATTAAQIIAGGEIRDRSDAQWSGRQKWGIAAALALVALLSVVALGPNRSGETRNQRFDAATTPGQLQTMDYVLELRFAAGVSVDDRQLIIAGLGGGNTVMSADQVHVKIVVRLPPMSLRELEQYAAEVQSRREILSAEVVALQLPVR